MPIGTSSTQEISRAGRGHFYQRLHRRLQGSPGKKDSAAALAYVRGRLACLLGANYSVVQGGSALGPQWPNNGFAMPTFNLYVGLRHTVYTKAKVACFFLFPMGNWRLSSTVWGAGDVLRLEN